MRRWPPTTSRNEQRWPEVSRTGGATEGEQAIEDIVGRAFLTAHLLTGNMDQAESATMAAIDSWNPDDETEEVLFEKALAMAARASIKRAPLSSNEPDVAGSCLPVELQRVLRLARPLRRCFVLRVLVGLPLRVCAKLLRSDSRRVEQCSCDACRYLGALDRKRLRIPY